MVFLRTSRGRRGRYVQYVIILTRLPHIISISWHISTSRKVLYDIRTVRRNAGADFFCRRGEELYAALGHSGESNRRSRRYRDRLTAKLGPLHVLKSPPCDTFAIRAPCPRARRVEAGGRNLVRVAPQRRRAEVPACASGWSPPCPCARAGLCAPRGVRSSRCLMAVTTGRRT